VDNDREGRNREEVGGRDEEVARRDDQEDLVSEDRCDSVGQGHFDLVQVWVGPLGQVEQGDEEVYGGRR